jgi:hypothetical protein
LLGAVMAAVSVMAAAQETVPGLGLDITFADDAVPKAEEPAAEESVWSRFQYNGYLKNETAYRYKEPRSITKIRNIAYLNVRYPQSDSLLFNFAGWAYYDLAYDLFDYQTIAARYERERSESLVFLERLPEEKDSPVADIRELYADINLEGMDLRIGKQYIIWGVLEGVRVVDEINPMDFRELILPDLLDYRVSLWSVKFDYFLSDSAVQLVWIPDLRFHKPAPRGSEWELLQDVCKDQEEDIVCVDSKPESWNLEDSEIGLRWDGNWGDTELTLSYFYTWDDFPVIFRAVPIDTSVFCNPGTPLDDKICINPSFFPTYTRMAMYGGTAVRQMGRYILKGEAAYVRGKYFGVKNDTDRDGNGFIDEDGAIQKDHMRWAAGVEFNIAGWDISPGITQWIILDYDKALLQKKFDTSLNLFVRKEFPAQAAVFQLLAIDLVTLDELLLKPKATFQIDDRLQLGVGMDLFFGKKSDFGTNQTASGSSTFDPSQARAQFIGNFHDNDRVYMEFKYSF